MKVYAPSTAHGEAGGRDGGDGGGDGGGGEGGGEGGGLGGGGEGWGGSGGDGGVKHLTSQSAQTYTSPHASYADCGPPSSQEPSLANWHVFAHWQPFSLYNIG